MSLEFPENTGGARGKCSGTTATASEVALHVAEVAWKVVVPRFREGVQAAHGMLAGSCFSSSSSSSYFPGPGIRNRPTDSGVPGSVKLLANHVQRLETNVEMLRNNT